MTRASGRDQLKPMERLIRILICLADDDRGRGVPIVTLLRMADLDEDTEAARVQLRRDLTILRRGGWDIENVAGEGEDGRYLLRARDNRLALLLTPGERAALGSLLYLNDIDRVIPPPSLGRLVHAVQDRSLVRCSYAGRRRVLHPDQLYVTTSGWVLAARMAADEPAKEYVIAWMDGLRIDRPGTAAAAIMRPTERLDPMHWQLDPPMTVRLAVVTPFVADVLVQFPAATVVPPSADTAPESTADDEPPETVVELVVTNQATFRSRLYALGLRVRVLEPATLVTEIAMNLQAVVESGG